MVSEHLLIYIKSSLDQGLDLKSISATLVNKGWQNTYIDEGMAEVQADPTFAKYFKAPAPKRSFAPILLIALLMLLGAAGAFAWKNGRLDGLKRTLGIPVTDTSYTPTSPY
ncbi:MAG: hypothetical protein WCO52_04075 [bacterium]